MHVSSNLALEKELSKPPSPGSLFWGMHTISFCVIGMRMLRVLRRALG